MVFIIILWTQVLLFSPSKVAHFLLDTVPSNYIAADSYCFVVSVLLPSERNQLWNDCQFTESMGRLQSQAHKMMEAQRVQAAKNTAKVMLWEYFYQMATLEYLSSQLYAQVTSILHGCPESETTNILTFQFPPVELYIVEFSKQEFRFCTARRTTGILGDYIYYHAYFI